MDRASTVLLVNIGVLICINAMPAVAEVPADKQSSTSMPERSSIESQSNLRFRTFVALNSKSKPVVSSNLPPGKVIILPSDCSDPTAGGSSLRRKQDEILVLSEKLCPHGWEFFGLSKAELQEKVANMNLQDLGSTRDKYITNYDITDLFHCSYPTMHWSFEYKNNRIEKVSRYHKEGSKDYDGEMLNQQQALSLAISECTQKIARSRKRLDDWLESGRISQSSVDMFFGEVYVQRAKAYEKIGQHELSQNDYRMASQLLAKANEQSSNGSEDPIVWRRDPKSDPANLAEERLLRRLVAAQHKRAGSPRSRVEPSDEY